MSKIDYLTDDDLDCLPVKYKKIIQQKIKKEQERRLKSWNKELKNYSLNGNKKC